MGRPIKYKYPKPGERDNRHVSNFQIWRQRKEFDLSDPKVKLKMNTICNIIENSIKRDVNFEDVASKLLDENSRYCLFLKTYIEEYNARLKLARKMVALKSTKVTDAFLVEDEPGTLLKIYNNYLRLKHKDKEENPAGADGPDMDDGER